MIKIDPILAVSDVEASAKWYQQVFGFQRDHGGTGRFAVLLSKGDGIQLCLHRWGDHGHPTMIDRTLTPGNGLILYFKTDNLNAIRQKAKELRATIEEEIHVNTNSQKREFSLRDPDGYYLTVSEYHEYEG